MKHYFNSIYLYFSKKSLYLVTLVTSFTILVPEVITTLLNIAGEERFFFIYSNFIVTLIINISGAILGYQIGNTISKKKIALKEFFLKNAYPFTILIVAHVLLRIYRFIIIDSLIFKVDEDTGLYPIIFLIIFQGLVYFFRAYFLPIIIFSQRTKFSLKQFSEFFIKKFFSILQDLILSCILSFLSIIIAAFIFSNIEKIVNILGNSHELHGIFERFIEIFFSVSFNHFFILFLLQKK